jgi:hypothetical protein
MYDTTVLSGQHFEEQSGIIQFDNQRLIAITNGLQEELTVD